MTAGRSGEFAWIERHFAHLAAEGADRLRDDAALLNLPGRTIVTQDTIVEGIHFFADDPPRTVAAKAIAVNVSDIVAKGGSPWGMMLALGVPDRWTDDDMAGLASSFLDEHRVHGTRMIGGDTTRSPERLTITVTMFGRPHGRYVSRGGARAGDLVALCGPVGDATLGLKLRLGELPIGPGADALIARQALPVINRVAAGAVARFATASMDVSDGLVGDLAKLCATSGVRAVIDLADLPLSPAARSYLGGRTDLLPAMATGGDDYVVVMTLDPHDAAALHALEGVDATMIGRVTEGEGVGVTLGGVPVEFERMSYTHD